MVELNLKFNLDVNTLSQQLVGHGVPTKKNWTSQFATLLGSSKYCARRCYFIRYELKVCQRYKISKLKSILYKSNLKNPSAFIFSSNGPHVFVHPARKYAAHLRKFWRQMDFPSYSYKKWTLVIFSYITFPSDFLRFRIRRIHCIFKHWYIDKGPEGIVL